MQKYKRDLKTSYILGMSLTVEALKQRPEYMVRVYLSKKAIKNRELDNLLNLCNKNNIEYLYDEDFIDKMSLKENCYCIGEFRKYHSSLETNKHIVLYNFDDPGELGTIMRSAVCFDFKDIVIVNSNIDYFDPKVIRASMGSFFHLNIEKLPDLSDYLNKYDHDIYPFVANGKKELKTLRLSRAYSLIIPQYYHDLDKLYPDEYYVSHRGFNEISLSSLSSIVLNYCYDQSASDRNNAYKVQN